MFHTITDLASKLGLEDNGFEILVEHYAVIRLLDGVFTIYSSEGAYSYSGKEIFQAAKETIELAEIDKQLKQEQQEEVEYDQV